MVKRDAMSYFRSERKIKIGEDHIGRLNSRVNWLMARLEEGELRPRILKRTEVLNVYHACFNPYSQKPPFNSTIAIDKQRDKDIMSDFTGKTISQVVKEMRDFCDKMNDDTDIQEMVKRAEEGVKKSTPLGFTVDGLASLVTGNSMKIPMRNSALLKGDADIVAPEYLRVEPLHIEHQTGMFTGLSISQLPDELSEGWLTEFFDLDAPTFISLHITPVDKPRAINALTKEIKVFQTRIDQYAKTDQITPSEILRKMKAAQDFQDSLTGNKEVFLYLSAYLGIHTQNMEERRTILDRIDGILSEKRAGYERPFTLQMEAMRSIFPF